ncbi:hypothetical protein GOBAR_DD29590 [Gossypium barbadense]|nr:hypothetical protein GOBAR_DD29590 [Gossypium barbadense]
MPKYSYHTHEVREENHASPMDDMGDEFVPNTDVFDILMGTGVDEETYFHNLNFMLHQIIRAIPRVRPTQPIAPPPVVMQETPIERFHRYKRENFYGTSKDDLITAGQWSRDTLRTLRPLHFTPKVNLKCIISLLKVMHMTGERQLRWLYNQSSRCGINSHSSSKGSTSIRHI